MPDTNEFTTHFTEECWLRGTPDIPGVSAGGRRQRRGRGRRHIFTVLQSSSFRVVGHIMEEGAVGQGEYIC